jgi:hypothetical protein
VFQRRSNGERQGDPSLLRRDEIDGPGRASRVVLRCRRRRRTPPLPYGGTTTSRDEFFEKVNAYTNQRASFRLETTEVFGDGDRLAGHFTATFTAHGSGETFLLDQAELYEVTGGAISKVEVFQRDTPSLIEFFDRNQPAP